MGPKASVLIAVYNSVRQLEMVLAGFSRQSFREFEVIIADDGSGPEMRAFVEQFSRHSPFSLRYLYQPDEGFRKCRILNQAVLASSSDYLIFIDGDCVPHKDFVSAHLKSREARTVLCGRRVDLSLQISSRMTPQDVLAAALDRVSIRMLLDALMGRTRHLEEALPISNPKLCAWFHRAMPKLFGCNYSLDRSLIEEVNGFNEDFTDYWGEDTELEYRLRLSGARFKWVRHHAIQYHLYHPQRSKTEKSCALLEHARNSDTVACRNGLVKLKSAAHTAAH